MILDSGSSIAFLIFRVPTLSELSKKRELYPVGLEYETFGIRVQDLNPKPPALLDLKGMDGVRTLKPKYISNYITPVT